MKRTYWHLRTKHIGRRILIFDQLDSTNSHAAGQADNPENDGLVVIARQQSAGRGQQGRSWHCPPSAGLLMSVLVFPPVALRRPVLLTAWAAVAVSEAIFEATGLQSRIKWPNDILLQGQKVCGILIEQGRGTVVGIGLNVNQSATDFARAGLPLAGSLAMAGKKQFDIDAIAQSVIQQLDVEYGQLCQGNMAELESFWKSRIGLIGKDVSVECLDGLRQGKLVDLTFAAVEVETANGLVRLPPESVKHVEGQTR